MTVGRVVQRRTAALPGKHAKKEPGRVARAEPHGPGAASSERNDDTIPVRRNQTLPKHVPNELLDLAHCAIKPTNMPALGVRA